MFDDIITLYNYSRDSTTKNDKWIRSVIKNIQYRKTSTKTVTAQGIINFAEIITVTIPISADTYGKTFLDYVDYIKQPNDMMSEYWTLNAQSNKDLILYGEYTDEITTDFTIADLSKKYGGYGTIRAVSDNTNKSSLKHWRVEAT